MKKILLIILAIFCLSCDNIEKDGVFYGTHYSGSKPSIVFYGDSRIDFMPIYKHIGNEYWNYGLGEAVSDTFLYNILPKTRYIISDIVVISIGINDYNIKNFPTYFSNIVASIDFISKKMPLSNIYVTNIIPTYNRNTSNENAQLQKIVEDKGCKFIYVAGMEDSEGFLLSELTYDGVHYNEEGNKIFMGKIREELNGSI